MRLGPALRENKARLEKNSPRHKLWKKSRNPCDEWVFPLPEAMGEKCPEAVAGWLLWASSFTRLGLSVLICKMDPKAEPLSLTWLLCHMRVLGVYPPESWHRMDGAQRGWIGVLEAFSRCCSPTQPTSLAAYCLALTCMSPPRGSFCLPWTALAVSMLYCMASLLETNTS